MEEDYYLGETDKSLALSVSCLLWGTCLVGRGHAGLVSVSEVCPEAP